MRVDETQTYKQVQNLLALHAFHKTHPEKEVATDDLAANPKSVRNEAIQEWLTTLSRPFAEYTHQHPKALDNISVKKPNPEALEKLLEDVCDASYST